MVRWNEIFPKSVSDIRYPHAIRIHVFLDFGELGTLRIAPETIDLSMISGAGEGIRTLDPNLGNPIFGATPEFANLRFSTPFQMDIAITATTQ
ncbi:hypothetical protein [Sphingobium aromaticiconvertens]|uniref:hypothetical protein n=1 Tax=Sphingobium aromaticiconvertens TaxID=365341 RepID=UPI003019A1FE